MRKLMLPLLATCAVFAVSVPSASASTLGTKLSKVSANLKALEKAVSLMDDVNKGQTGAINGVDGRVTTVVGNLTALDNKVTAIVVVATDALTKLQNGLLALASGVTSLAQSTATAAGTGNPNSSSTTTTASGSVPATSTQTLAAGTLYRQIVLSTGGAFGAGVPIGARTWVKMPDVAPIGYFNKWACTSAGATDTAAGVGYSVTCTAP